MLEIAFAQAREIMRSRDGAGFRFVLTMHGGATFDVVPPAHETAPKVSFAGLWVCELGDSPLVVRVSEIAAIQVVEC